MARAALRELHSNVQILESAIKNREPGLDLLIETRDLSERVLTVLYTQYPDEHPDLLVEQRLLRAGRVCAEVTAWFERNSRRREIRNAALDVVGHRDGEKWVLSDERCDTEMSLSKVLEREVRYSRKRGEWIAPESVWRALRVDGTGDFYVSDMVIIHTICSGAMSRMSVKERGEVMGALRVF